MSLLPNALFIPIILCVLLKSILVTDGKFFRFDYTYHHEIGGWLKFNLVPATWYDARLRCRLEGRKLLKNFDDSAKSNVHIIKLPPCGNENISIEYTIKGLNTTTGAVLASPLNEKLMAAMNKTSHDIFTGIHATISKGDYSSIEGVPLEKISLPWAADEPDNCDNSEECLILKKEGTVADVRCDEVFPYMCYRRTKNIGFITNCGTTDKGYNFNEKSGSCYKFHRVGRTWSRAFKICRSEGGYLAIINNDDEATILKDLFAKYPDPENKANVKYVALLGFYDWDKSGTWTTIQGQSLEEAGYSRWNTGQPDNGTAGQHCGAMFRNGLFDDMWCYMTAPFICEKDPQSLLDEDNIF